MGVINAGTRSLDCSSDVLQRYQGLVGLFFALRAAGIYLQEGSGEQTNFCFHLPFYAYRVAITPSLYRSC